MQLINKHLLRRQETQKRLQVLEANIITIKNYTDLIYQAQRMHFLPDVFQMTSIEIASVINHYDINGLHLFWDTL